MRDKPPVWTWIRVVNLRGDITCHSHALRRLKHLQALRGPPVVHHGELPEAGLAWILQRNSRHLWRRLCRL